MHSEMKDMKMGLKMKERENASSHSNTKISGIGVLSGSYLSLNRRNPRFPFLTKRTQFQNRQNHAK